MKAHCAALFWTLLLTQPSVMAADGRADMSFHGTLIAPPPCVINEGGQVDVDFTERVGISKVDGVNYRVPVNYQITCEDGGSGLALSLSLSGTAAAFDSQALQSDQPGLGIRIYQDEKAFTPNSTLNIDLATPPRLEAVPVKRAGVTLKEGAFEAWATLQANYQ
ncbi:fimbrial protein [Scandinavium sp. UTDF21-P1B]|uniref:fimbrial protein n=1 Tax=Scandinavium sp. UTDF21-P1B TaxID=3446379 RepID=UPI003F529E24